jgi:hypothetical protein
MTDAEKCCIALDYQGYEAHHMTDGAVWISVWNRELTETTEFELSKAEVSQQADVFDQYYKLHESFRKWLQQQNSDLIIEKTYNT